MGYCRQWIMWIVEQVCFTYPVDERNIVVAVAEDNYSSMESAMTTIIL